MPEPKPDSLTIADLHQDPANARRRTERSGDMLQRSLQEVGAARSIVIDEEGTILAGNGTVEAAGKVGITRVRVVDADGEEIIAVRRKGLTAEQKRRLAYYDNRTAELAEWDLDQLLADQQAGADFSGLWADDELGALLASLPAHAGDGAAGPPPEPETDRAEELQEKWGTERGQLWLIPSADGRRTHRLLCGDATAADDVARLLDGQRAHLAFTSPPYNVGANGKGGGVDLRERKYRNDDDDRTEDEYGTFLLAATDRMLERAETVMLNVQLLGGNKGAVIRLLWDRAGAFKDILHWVKPSAAPHIQPGVMGSRVEWVIGFSLTNPSKRFDRSPVDRGNLWNVVELAGASLTNEFTDLHNATFPPALAEHVVTSFSRPGDAVLDTFVGTGTTLAVAETTGRVGYGLDIEPAYVAVTLDRLSRLGLTPELAEATADA